MLKLTSHVLRSAVILALCLTFTVMAQSAEPTGDPFMGDWQGTLREAGGGERAVCGQVICWGNSEYQMNLLEAFDKRIAPLAVLQGKLAEGKVVFGDTATLAGEQLTGNLAGQRTGKFTMKHVLRQSPTLGAKPPEGAIVLFDGASLKGWQTDGDKPWVVNLAKAVGGDNRVAYLRSRVWSPKAQAAQLQVGSDDGVKVWLNGAVVHANNALRALALFEDKVDVDLKEGWNDLKLKITQGGGGWETCARVRSREGTDLPGLKFEPTPQLEPGQDMKELQGESTGTIVTWELSGPYTQEGKNVPELFDIAFAPEQSVQDIKWRVANEKPASAREWKLVDGGAMQVVPGSGNLISKRKFRDHKFHVEFRTPFMPTARGQGRGNSGVYVQSRYEIQVLDSYGLEGAINECGAMYGVAPPLVNMCAPPLQWQTYDVEFHNARFDKDGKKIEEASITVLHNGVLVHDHLKLQGGTANDTGGILLQDHGNLVEYRNIWVVEF